MAARHAAMAIGQTQGIHGRHVEPPQAIPSRSDKQIDDPMDTGILAESEDDMDIDQDAAPVPGVLEGPKFVGGSICK